jgi:uncharacterized protein YdhG (YjbR/CyaY superfamily)
MNAGRQGAASVVDAYIAARPDAHRPHLEKLRAAINAALPGATEGLSYGIPVFKVEGKMVMYFAAFAAHYSVYPATADTLKGLGEAAAPYRSGKATLRFSYEKPVPVRLIAKFARLRAAHARATAKKAAQKRTRKAR